MVQLQACHQRVQLVTAQQAVVAGVGGLQFAPVVVFLGGVGTGQHDRILHGGLGVLRLAQIGVGLLVVLKARNQQEPDKKHNEGQHQNDVQQNFIAPCHWCNFHSALLYCCGAASTQRRSME